MKNFNIHGDHISAIKTLKNILMKIRFFFSAILALSFGLLSAQSPQGVNYQAVVRDGSGNIISGQEIELVLSVLDNGLNVVWKESHEETTNSFGLVSVVLGQGTYISGTKTAFADIVWSTGSYSLKTEVVYNGGSPINMGTSPILSVPYALEAAHAKSADAYSGVSRTNQLLVDGVTENVEESLFEVKNVDGQTVFAVYNEGVQIFVSDGDAKGVKGGFAVKGFGDGKAEPTDLLVISADSTRLYIGANESKGVKGGFAVTGFGGSKGEGTDLLVVNSDSTRIYIGANESKGVKGGFAVGSFSDVTKGGNEEYFRVTRDSTRVYVQTDEEGNMLGGFAVQGQTTDTETGETTNTEFFSVARDTANNTALGFGTIANQPYETVIGLYNDTTSFEWAQRLFTIGDGTGPEERSNALVILKNGNVGIGVTEQGMGMLSEYGLVVESNGVYISGPEYYYQEPTKGMNKGQTSVWVEGMLSANAIYLDATYDQQENFLYPPALYVEGGYMSGGSLELNGAYNMDTQVVDPPYLNVYGGSVNTRYINADTINTQFVNMANGLINTMYLSADTINTKFASVDTLISPAYISMGNSYKIADTDYTYGEYSYIEGALSAMIQSEVSAYNFEWSSDFPELPQGQSQFGLFAQDLEYNFPQIVKTIDGVKMVDYDQIVALLWQAVLEMPDYIYYNYMQPVK